MNPLTYSHIFLSLKKISGEEMPAIKGESMNKLEWDRSETLVLAHNSCTRCHGLGLISGKRGKQSPCNCVLRSIFRICYARFRHCALKEKYLSKASMQLVAGPKRRLTWGRKDEEYVADFCLISRRYLAGLEYTIFKYHFLLGADWKICCRRLSLDRGNFFHAVYRIQQQLGRVFRELQPYGLYPLDEYFHSTYRENPIGASVAGVIPIRSVNGPRPIRPPLRQTA